MRRKRAVESIGGNIKTLHLRDIQEGGSENAFVGGGFKKEDRQEVTIVQVVCNKFNCITIVKGVELFAEANVFASSFVDATVAVWDVGVGKSHALAFKAQKDVNVISWNRFFCQDGMLWYHILRSISILPRQLSKALMNPQLLQPLLAIISSRYGIYP
ncbi:uncharacterized protein LOC103856622 isoform X1 [Brassica rapa]|uniref:uncharacterized protein LOC103856622 isoform X1 n=1 Tax=Brassica campestris TaxID=3711 RepID=UPI000873230A|nr:uncharacterized protein LOC103856622 isoform X1 [Brassica rapa]XP_033142766.1 uncharacterized protein LOC103856622 isoform X1 [Brassica rapa]